MSVLSRAARTDCASAFDFLTCAENCSGRAPPPPSVPAGGTQLAQKHWTPSKTLTHAHDDDGAGEGGCERGRPQVSEQACAIPGQNSRNLPPNLLTSPAHRYPACFRNERSCKRRRRLKTSDKKARVRFRALYVTSSSKESPRQKKYLLPSFLFGSCPCYASLPFTPHAICSPLAPTCQTPGKLPISPPDVMSSLHFVQIRISPL